MKIFIKSSEVASLPDNTIVLHIGERNDKFNIDLYNQAHIGNAHYISFVDTLTQPAGQHGGRNPLPDMDEFKTKMKDLGISKETPVLLYAPDGIIHPCRMYTILKSLGVKTIYVLYDTLMGYLQEGFPVETGESKATPTKVDDLEFNHDLIVDYDYVKNAIGNDDVRLVDSRNASVFGAGHIPGACNYFCMELIKKDPPSQEEIKQHFKDIDPSKENIIYCGSGMTANVNIVLLDEIGIPNKLYTGSYSDWSSY